VNARAEKTGVKAENQVCIDTGYRSWVESIRRLEEPGAFGRAAVEAVITDGRIEMIEVRNTRTHK
jgi:hypothetical protein